MTEEHKKYFERPVEFFASMIAALLFLVVFTLAKIVAWVISLYEKLPSIKRIKCLVGCHHYSGWIAYGRKHSRAKYCVHCYHTVEERT